MVLLNQMVILFLIMAVGFLCQRVGILDEHTTKKLSGLVINVANPCMLVAAALGDHTGADKLILLRVVWISILVFAGLMALSLVVPKLLRAESEIAPLYRIMTVFSNIGFMGLPVIAATYGSEALLYGSIFQLPYNFLIYTFGIAQMTGEPIVKGGIRWKKIFNVGVISGIAAILIYVLEIPFPSFLGTTIEKIGSLTAPVSMMVIGYSFSKMKLKELLSDVRLVLFSAIKLLGIPVVGVAICRLAGIEGNLLGVCFIMLSMPVGSMTAMLATQYGIGEKVTSRGVALTTVLSVITIPLMSLLLGV